LRAKKINVLRGSQQFLEIRPTRWALIGKRRKWNHRRGIPPRSAVADRKARVFCRQCVSKPDQEEDRRSSFSHINITLDGRQIFPENYSFLELSGEPPLLMPGR